MMMEGRRTRLCLRAGFGLAALMGSASTTAFAMPACLSRSSITAEGLLRPYGAPLDRAVTIDEADLPLRVALDRIASMARVRLTYSADLLPREKRVCLNLDRVPVGVALTELLRGSLLRPLVIDGDNVVLTPSRGPTASEPLPETLNTVTELDRIVVTGTADGARQRASAFALDVIDRRAMVNNDISTLSAALDGAVPGMWMWSPSPSSTIGRFGSVRGASSFGVTSPKIYVDGIEMANALVLTQFDPERIDRVEVIRGPQGAALYGSGAISGVVNIITRHDGARPGEPLRYFRTRAGVSASDYSASGTLVQDHSVGVRAGTGRRSFGVGLNVGTVGNYIPGGAARSFMADGDVKLVGSRTVFTGIARYSLKNAGALASPLLLGISSTTPPTYNTANNSAFGTPAGAPPPPAGQASQDNSNYARLERLRAGYVDSTLDQSQSVQQYTIGTTSTFVPDARWTHTLVAGVDGYRLNGMTMEGIPIPVRLDAASRSVHSESDRTTLAARSVARFGNEDAVATTLTLGAEHAATRYRPEWQDTFSAGDLSLSANLLKQNASVWSNTAGVLAQLNSSIRNNIFLSAGGRIERTTGLVTGSNVSVLPMIGAAWVREHEGQTLKFRASYGKGIRPSNSALRGATWMSGQNLGLVSGGPTRLTLGDLEPESQAGVEFGADWTLDRRVSVHITRFDQRATGLIQAVALPRAARMSGRQLEPGITYELQNVGAIANRGWELQASSMIGALALRGSAAFVDSRVQRVARQYGGELLPGDRMLEVPSRTLSVQASYSASRWSTAWTAARAMDWINYDQLRLAEQRQVAGFDSKMVTGGQLRNYWRHYDGATRLRGNVNFAVARGLSLVVTGDNLFNLQHGEPDNVTVIPGRTLTAGFRTRF